LTKRIFRFGGCADKRVLLGAGKYGAAWTAVTDPEARAASDILRARITYVVGRCADVVLNYWLKSPIARLLPSWVEFLQSQD
jgi:hypothetical protein